MAKIKYVEFDGTEHMLEVPPGMSVMEGAVNNAIPGIEAECGGACACATCHVYVDPAWQGRTGTREQLEAEMLDFGADIRPNSRLSCQIRVSEDLDGLVVYLPKTQRA
jgi:2Fe-2S ferredoxin